MYDGWIPDEEVQLFLRAADVLVIPREGVLNSGNVALGFTFGRVVVGPDEGVIGEVLRKTNNPVYEPGDAQVLSDALKAVRNSDTRRGERNKAYAMEEMRWEKVASRHVDLYREVLK
jgi:glycosyltransferase involved in cell wall biosynthesis